MTRFNGGLAAIAVLAAMLLAAGPAQAAQGGQAPGQKQAAPGAISVLTMPGLAGTQDSQPLTRTNIFSTARKIIKCGSHIIGFIAGNVVLVAKLKKAGGVFKVAKKVFKAKGRKRKLKALLTVFGEVAGLNEVAEGCGL